MNKGFFYELWSEYATYYFFHLWPYDKSLKTLIFFSLSLLIFTFRSPQHNQKMSYTDHGGHRRHRRRNHPSSISAVLLYLTFHSIINLVGASIHDYQNETFIHRANSFFFHGGSEGLYASKPIEFNHSLDNFPTGKSFIR